VFETDPFAPCPGAQLLVNAFPRHADHFADLLLRDRDGQATLRRSMPFGQANQRTGEAARQILKNNLFDLIACPAQPHAKQFDEFHRQLRLASYEGKEFAPINDKNLAICICRCVGSSRVPVEQRHFPKNFAGTDQVQDRTAPVRRGNADLDRAADHRDQAVARIALRKNRRPSLQGVVLGITAKLVECLCAEVAEDRVLAQHRQLVAQKLPGFPGFVLRHASQVPRSGADTRRLASKISMIINIIMIMVSFYSDLE